jgi:signal transduction histidine kinase
MILAKLISLVALAGYMALIVISLHQNGRRQVNRAFLLYLSAMLFWQLSAVMVTFINDPRAALVWYRLMTAGMAGQFIFYCFFVLAFTEAKQQRPIYTAGWIMFIFLLLSSPTDLIIKDVVLSTTGIYVPTFGTLVPMVGLITFFYLAYGIYQLVRYTRHTRSLLQRNRIRYLLVGAAVIAVGAFSNLTPHLQSFPVDVTANVINALIIAIAIGRHRLLDMSIMLRKGLLYSIPTMFIGTSYLLLITLIVVIFHTSTSTQIYISLLVAVVIALVAQPLMFRAQQWIDRLFFREKYDATQMLQRLSQSAAELIKLDDLTSMILKEVTDTIHIQKAAFFLKNDRSGIFRLTAHSGIDNGGANFFRKDHPIMNWLEKNKKPLSHSEIEMQPQFKALWGREKDELERLAAELFIPVCAKNELVGVFVLGPKRSELQYSSDDVTTLTTVANQTAMAIENARLFWQLEGMVEALSVAHDELELRVQERTSQLATANQALQAENAERVRAEEAIQRYAKELERSNKELQQFAYVASHDLQEPLRMVASFLQLLERRYSEKLDQNAKDYIFYAVDGAKRMQTLILDLLEYSRVGTRGKPFAKINLNEVIQQVQSNLKITIRENKAKIACSRLPMVFGDDTQLIQVFQNLIGNAIKFHGEQNPEIHVSSKRKNGNYEIMVRDNGIGIDPHYAERIFLIFQRLHNREDYPGNGIGLAICKRIVERHGGTIWVESQAEQGATFHVTLPAKAKEAV